MNFELGWRDVGITLFAIAQHFSLFTFHFPKRHISLK